MLNIASFKKFFSLLPLLGLASSVALGSPPRHGVLRYEAAVTDIPQDAQTIDVWLPIPPSLKEQEIRSVNVAATIDGKFHTGSVYGNRIWHGRFTRPADGIINVAEVVEFIRKPVSSAMAAKPSMPESPSTTARYLRPSQYVPLTKRFSKIAINATASHASPMGKARSLYDFVLKRMTYDKSGQGWGRGDANYACDIGKGNCSDFHSLFIALSRSVNIPSRFWIGFPLPPKHGHAKIGGYHCWAEFFIEGAGWVTVDISEADKHPEKAEYFFGNLDENRIAFSLGRDLVLTPQQKGPPLNFFIYPYVEIDGIPWDKVETSFSVDDAPADADPG